MSISPTQRTLKQLRTDGFDCAIAEHWNPFAKIRQDLFGFIDILAVKKSIICGVQCTSRTNHSARRKKILSLPMAKRWLIAGGLIAIYSWGTGRKPECRIESITLEDFGSE